MGEGKPESQQHADWKAPKPEDDRKQYPPGIIADFEISRAMHDTEMDKKRERLRQNYDADTVRIVADVREEKGDAAADSVQARREANRDRYIEETVQMWARHEMEYDLKDREKDRKRIKPKDKTQALGDCCRITFLLIFASKSPYFLTKIF